MCPDVSILSSSIIKDRENDLASRLVKKLAGVRAPVEKEG